jgi:aspartyl-tRNA(Asn)/glutamyl-tRNA(Gln) amidotransferase subunit C
VRLTPEQVDHLAHLARLALREDEKAALTADLNQIVAAVEKIDALDLAGVEPTLGVEAPLAAAALRADEPRPSLSREDALAMAPERTDEGFAVPRVISEGA